MGDLLAPCSVCVLTVVCVFIKGTYCMPEDGVPLQDEDRMLTSDEIVRLAELFVVRLWSLHHHHRHQPRACFSFCPQHSRVCTIPFLPVD